MSGDKEEDKLAELDKIYQEYSRNLLDLRKQQDKIVSDFIEALKQASVEEIRRKIETSNG